MKRLAVAVIAFAVAFASLAGAATPPATAVVAPMVADTSASLQARRVLQAAAVDDDATFLAFAKQVYPTVNLATAEWMGMRGHLASFRFHGVVAATPTHAELSLYNPGMAAWMILSVDVQPEAPHLITDVALRLSDRPADVPAPPKLAPTELVAATRADLATEVAADRFAGAVLIAHEGKVLFARAYGMADREARVPNRLDTQFRFGSAGKLFTSVAIMQLAQAGKLDLNAPIGRYLPDYPNREIAEHATINQLLSHAGGTGDYFGPEFDAHRDALRTPKDYIDLYGARPPLFPPGSGQDYSNYGFMILGRVVEVVSGLSYPDYLQKYIFGPAGMTSTGTEPETVNLPRRATGYLTLNGRLERVTDVSIQRYRAINHDGYREYRGGPAGGGYSTVGDFLRFATALTSNKLLDADHLRQMTQNRITLTNGHPAGYDFGGRLPDGRRFIGHAGAAPGQSAVFRIYPGDYVIVVLANRDLPAVQHVMGFIGDRLP